MNDTPVQRPDPAFPQTITIRAGNVNPFTGQKVAVDFQEVFAGLSASSFLAAAVKSLDDSDPVARGAIRKVVRREMAAQFLAASIAGREVGDVKLAVHRADALLKELGE